MKDIRQAIVTALEAPFKAAFPAHGLVFDNGPFDWDNPPENFTHVEVEFQAGNQIGMASRPKTRVRGHVYVAAHVRRGAGSNTALDASNWIGNALEYKTIGRARLQEAKPEGTKEPPGWYVVELKVPFYADPA